MEIKNCPLLGSVTLRTSSIIPSAASSYGPVRDTPASLTMPTKIDTPASSTMSTITSKERSNGATMTSTISPARPLKLQAEIPVSAMALATVSPYCKIPSGSGNSVASRSGIVRSGAGTSASVMFGSPTSMVLAIASKMGRNSAVVSADAEAIM